MDDDFEERPSKDFEDFWAEYGQRPVERIMIFGVECDVPTDLPLAWEIRAKRVMDSEESEDIEMLVADMYGDHVFEKWVKAGLTSRQYQFLLMWGGARANGRNVSFEGFWPEFEEVEQKAREREAREHSGKAPENREERRRRTKKRRVY